MRARNHCGIEVSLKKSLHRIAEVVPEIKFPCGALPMYSRRAVPRTEWAGIALLRRIAKFISGVREAAPIEGSLRGVWAVAVFLSLERRHSGGIRLCQVKLSAAVKDVFVRLQSSPTWRVRLNSIRSSFS